MEDSFYFETNNRDFSYSADDFIKFFEDKDIRNLGVVNPDNPTGNYIENLEKNRHLFIVKSISKSYGVPGLRLGVLASGDVKMISELKKDVAIWNINSFAEFYMQIAEKYQKEYELELVKFRAERNRYQEEISKISGIWAISSQANYIMVEIVNGMSAGQLTKRLFLNHNLIVKDLSEKLIQKGQYIRIAIRNAEDNNKLIEALKTEL